MFNKGYNWIYGIIAAIILIIAAIPILNNIQAKKREGAITMELSMQGFSPNVIEGKVGEPIKLYLVNLDDSNHVDGGGWHQVASDELDFDFNIPPKNEQLVTITVNEPGEYTFYCDVCCGGKENPSMQGKLIIS